MMSQMIEVNTAELTGQALNFAVAISDGWSWDGQKGYDGYMAAAWLSKDGTREQFQNFRYSCSWHLVGQLIEKYRLAWQYLEEDEIEAWVLGKSKSTGMIGGTQIIASCRAIVKLKLGDTVKVPAELVTP
jgi:hypothetical protein